MEEENIQNEEVIQQEDVSESEGNGVIKDDVVLPAIESVPAAQASKPKNDQERNYREMRLSKERAEKDRAALEQRVAQYEAAEAKRDATIKAGVDAYGDDDFVEGKHLKKEIADVRNQLKNYEKQVATQADESRLKNRYADFDKVVNADTIARLKEEDPEFAETIAYSQSSLYARGSSTYRKIRDLGLYVEDKHEQDRAKAQQNVAKPRPLNSVSPQQGDSPLSMANAFANGLTPDLKKQLWKEMQAASKRS